MRSGDLGGSRKVQSFGPLRIIQRLESDSHDL